jgi:hypothetical protein
MARGHILPRLSDPDSLWTVILSPTIWAGHFLAVYLWAAILCQKAPDAGVAGLPATRIGIAVLTLLALGLIGWAGRVAWTRWRGEEPDDAISPFEPHDDDTVASRRRFSAYAAVLLAGLSAVGVIYQSLPALFFDSCL